MKYILKNEYPIQIVLSIILTLIGIFFAVTFSLELEAPPSYGENCIILFVALLNAFWFIPFIIHYIRNKKKRNLKKSTFIFLIFVMPFVFYRLYYKPFDSLKWKSELDYTKYYDKYPAHINGNMVEKIIDSDLLIGPYIEDIKELLGKNYYIDTYENDTTLNYFYSNKNILDGCDKLYVNIKNGKCIKSGYGGCD